ncbi:hypothetical protein HDV05_008795 [Chytridiales sp. JEL 0842]|nr:hypothetical protein HDV05_008795 [Chytridiales sp. JEL 0842]
MPLAISQILLLRQMAMPVASATRSILPLSTNHPPATSITNTSSSTTTNQFKRRYSTRYRYSHQRLSSCPLFRYRKLTPWSQQQYGTHHHHQRYFNFLDFGVISANAPNAAVTVSPGSRWVGPPSSPSSSHDYHHYYQQDRQERPSYFYQNNHSSSSNTHSHSSNKSSSSSSKKHSASSSWSWFTNILKTADPTTALAATTLGVVSTHVIVNNSCLSKLIPASAASGTLNVGCDSAAVVVAGQTLVKQTSAGAAQISTTSLGAIEKLATYDHIPVSRYQRRLEWISSSKNEKKLWAPLAILRLLPVILSAIRSLQQRSKAFSSRAAVVTQTISKVLRVHRFLSALKSRKIIFNHIIRARILRSPQAAASSFLQTPATAANDITTTSAPVNEPRPQTPHAPLNLESITTAHNRLQKIVTSTLKTQQTLQNISNLLPSSPSSKVVIAHPNSHTTLRPLLQSLTLLHSSGPSAALLPALQKASESGSLLASYNAAMLLLQSAIDTQNLKMLEAVKRLLEFVFTWAPVSSRLQKKASEGLRVLEGVGFA